MQQTPTNWSDLALTATLAVSAWLLRKVTNMYDRIHALEKQVQRLIDRLGM